MITSSRKKFSIRIRVAQGRQNRRTARRHTESYRRKCNRSFQRYADITAKIFLKVARQATKSNFNQPVEIEENFHVDAQFVGNFQQFVQRNGLATALNLRQIITADVDRLRQFNLLESPCFIWLKTNARRINFYGGKKFSDALNLIGCEKIFVS